MRRIIVSMITFLFSCATISNAQLIESYGAKVAYTSSSQEFDYPTSPVGWWTGIKTSARSGFNVAAFAEWFNLPIFSIESQIEYAERGAHLEYVVPGGTKSTAGRLDYISVPLLAKVSLPIGASSSYLLAGPRADFLIDYQEVEIQPDMNPFYGDFKKAMLGGSIGVGIQSGSLLSVAPLLEFRYNVDFFDSYNKDDLKVRNDAVDIWLGVAL